MVAERGYPSQVKSKKCLMELKSSQVKSSHGLKHLHPSLRPQLFIDADESERQAEGHNHHPYLQVSIEVSDSTKAAAFSGVGCGTCDA